MPPPVPPSPELLRFKIPLLVVGCLYIVLIIVGIVVGAVSSALNDLFVGMAALLMALRANECMGQCTLPFILFAAMALFFDIFSIISTMTQGSPGVSDFFSDSCPLNQNLTTQGNITVYLPENPLPGCSSQQSWIVPNNTALVTMIDHCSSRMVMQNVTIIISILLDIVATYLGYQMLKTAGPGGGMGGMMGGGAPLMGGGGQGGDPGGDFPQAGGPGGGGGGGGQGFGGAGNRLGGNQEQGIQQTAMAGRQGGGGGFTPYQGSGQVLGSA